MGNISCYLLHNSRHHSSRLYAMSHLYVAQTELLVFLTLDIKSPRLQAPVNYQLVWQMHHNMA